MFKFYLSQKILILFFKLGILNCKFSPVCNSTRRVDIKCFPCNQELYDWASFKTHMEGEFF